VNIETSDQILLPPGETEEDVSVEARTLRLRLMEAGIYRDHLRLLRKTWAYRATTGGAAAFVAFAVALWPYLGGAGKFRLPMAISYVAAFVFVIALVFALVSVYRAIVAASLVSRATFKIKRAEAVQAVFGIPMREQV
jgi:hypothetical protein